MTYLTAIDLIRDYQTKFITILDVNVMSGTDYAHGTKLLEAKLLIITVNTFSNLSKSFIESFIMFLYILMYSGSRLTSRIMVLDDIKKKKYIYI